MPLERAPTNLREGDILAGKYVVERVLGAGGMGMVLAGRHKLLGSPVAIKVLLPAASGIPGAQERFVREARAAAALRSEHVARVMDVGLHDDGTPYLVMEYLSGIDLRQALRTRGPMRVADVADYMVQVFEAIAEAHGLGIVHRDLKPGNLFLTQRPNGAPLVKVLDFGLAKVLEEAPKAAGDASLTATGLVVGSPPYMPPEQLRSLKLADARSDIWSLGVVLFELLTGRQPFLADRPEGLIVAIATDNPPSPRSLRPDVPESIDALILHCLRKDPRERPQSVRDLAAVLEPFVTPRSSMASAVTFGLAASSPGAPAMTGGPERGPAAKSGTADIGVARGMTLPMSPMPDVPLAAAVPFDHRGATAPTSGAPAATSGATAPTSGAAALASGATTLTSGATDLPTVRAQTRRPTRQAWMLGAAGATVLAGAVGLAISLVPGRSSLPTEAVSPGATLDLPSPLPAPSVRGASSAEDVASASPPVTASPSESPGASAGTAASSTTSTSPSPTAAATSKGPAPHGTSGPRDSAGVPAPAVPSTPKQASQKPTTTGKVIPDPLKQWN